MPSSKFWARWSFDEQQVYIAAVRQGLYNGVRAAHRGLVNEVNECWANAALHVMLRLPLLKLLVQGSERSGDPLLRQTRLLQHAVSTSPSAAAGAVTPTWMMEFVWESLHFPRYRQCDSGEFVEKFYLRLGAGSSGIRMALPLFLEDRLTCSCGHAHTNRHPPDPILRLALPATSGTADDWPRDRPALGLSSLMEAAFKPSTAPGVDCPNCKQRRDMGQQTRVNPSHSLPGILTVLVKRFDSDGRKLHHAVKAPDVLDLPAAAAAPAAGSRRYHLRGIVSHHGATRAGGHYTSLVRTGGIWLHCNDSIVTRVRSASHCRSGYVFFYSLE